MKHNNLRYAIITLGIYAIMALISCKKTSTTDLSPQSDEQNLTSHYIPITRARIDSANLVIQRAKDALTQSAIAGNIGNRMMEFSDASGLIKIQVFESVTGPAQHNYGTATVGADYVLVGGGAYTENVEYSGGAYLTESRPDFGLTTWYAASKDHWDTDPHTLRIYAIGMRIVGVTSDALRSYMQVFSTTSGAANHPNTSVTVPSNYLLIGGGAKVNWNGFGNILTRSYPSGNTWYVASKDHLVADVSTITAYAIGIQNVSLPVIGFVSVGNSSGSGYAPSGRAVASASLPSGWVTTCPGGYTTYGSTGRMLMEIKMDAANPFNVSTMSKDLRYADAGYIYPYAVRIQKL